MKLFVLLAVICLSTFGCTSSHRQTSEFIHSANRVKSPSKFQDNSTSTLDELNKDQQDIVITSRIRKLLVVSKMSSNARNTKIRTRSGKVTLSGPRVTSEEKTKIEAIACKVVGAKNVNSEILVAEAD